MAVAAVQPPWATLVDPADGAWVRAANFAIACQAVRGGDRLVLTGLPDEHLALLVGTGARIETASGVVQAPADALVIVEPGDSAIEPDGDGRIVRVVTTRGDAARKREPELPRAARGRHAARPTGQSDRARASTRSPTIPSARGRCASSAPATS